MRVSIDVRFPPIADIAERQRRELYRPVANSLDLDPEWGSIDLIEDVEGAFVIKIADEEAERFDLL